ncbi:cytotoxin [Bacillus sp. RO2]|uniref:SAR2788 family putative toxin n=1 Tax=Bacillus sp. RO2 TaxID=2723913 RepID=UPI00145ECBB8|nr:SAR2788 family putative toxin [Bacillus sp. RO2]NMH73614.1 cytotoxin [Bacillus sp. RO2]
MRKLLIKIMVFTMVLSTLPMKSNAEEVTPVQRTSENSSILTDTLHTEVTKETDQQIVVNSKLNTQNFKASVDVHLFVESETIEVFGNVIETSGDIIDVHFDVTVIESKDEHFVAIFHDKATGEDYVYNSKEVNASILPAIPIIVAFIARAGVQKAIQHFGKNTLREIAKNMTKADSPVWKKFSSFRGKTKTSGSGKKKRYYEWDNTHNDIEVYDHKGNHLGSMDPLTGEMYKPAVNGRKINL